MLLNIYEIRDVASFLYGLRWITQNERLSKKRQYIKKVLKHLFSQRSDKKSIGQYFDFELKRTKQRGLFVPSFLLS